MWSDLTPLHSRLPPPPCDQERSFGIPPPLVSPPMISDHYQLFTSSVVYSNIFSARGPLLNTKGSPNGNILFSLKCIHSQHYVNKWSLASHLTPPWSKVIKKLSFELPSPIDWSNYTLTAPYCSELFIFSHISWLLGSFILCFHIFNIFLDFTFIDCSNYFQNWSFVIYAYFCQFKLYLSF